MFKNYILRPPSVFFLAISLVAVGIAVFVSLLKVTGLGIALVVCFPDGLVSEFKVSLIGGLSDNFLGAVFPSNSVVRTETLVLAFPGNFDSGFDNFDGGVFASNSEVTTETLVLAFPVNLDSGFEDSLIDGLPDNFLGAVFPSNSVVRAETIVLAFPGNLESDFEFSLIDGLPDILDDGVFASNSEVRAETIVLDFPNDLDSGFEFSLIAGFSDNFDGRVFPSNSEVRAEKINLIFENFWGKANVSVAETQYKISDFLPTDWQMWEQNESDPFFFNDAGNNPESIGETLSMRHSGVPNSIGLPFASAKNLPGGAVVGRFGGSADYVKWNKCYNLVNKKEPAPNELLNGPRYRK